MKIDIIDLYKDDYKAAYIVNNKDKRKRVILIGNDGSRLGMTLARYIWETHNGKVPYGLEVDHINNDKTDDRIENLQLLTQIDNIRKEAALHPARLVDLICPICGKTFKFAARNLSTRNNPCCSRKCGYKKGVLTRKASKVEVP